MPPLAGLGLPVPRQGAPPPPPLGPYDEGREVPQAGSRMSRRRRRTVLGHVASEEGGRGWQTPWEET